MKKLFLLIIVLALFLTSCTGTNKPGNSSSSKNGVSNSNTTISNSDDKSNNNNAAENKKATTESKKTTTVIKVFLIAIDDNGKSGKKLDTGDSVVAVERVISTPETPLKGALSDLFSIKDRIYGKSGLYNTLYKSNLKVESAKIVNGAATVNLSGTFSLGGVMDIPRVKAQLIETVMQFQSVKSAKIYINGKTLDDALSLK
ncbi:GerMN domain-containing protein [Clostridium sp. JN-9]|uniref:GerMN domain-containing protein n=1 Tax=Clostridium sp. JN-9 TaxID=2507159 RepID=UPI000FFE04EA|nr:GerMN domain-containing protein [Clostridium sp. JN-9]QAT40134.1 hypothetical protein EQM05_07630 [Clostridium sp. JN-9]